MLKKLSKWVTMLAKYIRDDFYESEKTFDSMFNAVYLQYEHDTVCLQCGKYSKVELCKQCDY